MDSCIANNAMSVMPMAHCKRQIAFNEVLTPFKLDLRHIDTKLRGRKITHRTHPKSHKPSLGTHPSPIYNTPFSNLSVIQAKSV